MFHKKKPMSYISHHDTVRLFERSFRRAGLALEFSQGYNPQPKISFAQPLPLGVEGEREYGEFELSNKFTGDVITDKINFALTQGIKVKDIKKIDEGLIPRIPKMMSIVDASLYEICFDDIMTHIQLENVVSDIKESNEIIITSVKRGKKRQENTYNKKDIKQMIYGLEVEGCTIKALIKTGSRGNLRPDELARTVLAKNNNGKHLYEEDDIHKVNLLRKELYYNDSKRKRLKPLWEYM